MSFNSKNGEQHPTNCINLKNTKTMATLKSQIENMDWSGIERESNQECNIIERKMAPNGCGAEFLKVEFISTGHPFDAKGLTVVILDEGYADIDSAYLKTIFA